MRRPGKVTQRDIARIAGVSQAAVSMVLNGGEAGHSRIPAETRERVLAAIRDTNYVADPIARRMAAGRNQILGVFTYEPAFPSEQADFFAPFLLGIEEAAQELGYDLLLMTGSSGGQKKIFGENVRLRLADGCLVLGREFDRDELSKLVQGDYPFVAIGRREDAGGPVPYCGTDYVHATTALVERAARMGHRRFAYVGPKDGAESLADRWQGFQAALGNGVEMSAHLDAVVPTPDEMLSAILGSNASVAVFTELSDAVKVRGLARARNIDVPRDLSILVLGRHERAAETGTRFTTYRIPREQMGREAVRMLVHRIETDAPVEQMLLDCELIEGETLANVTS